MQALRHVSRRALRASVMQENFGASVKAFSSEAVSPASARKTKEERIELAKQFVAKFKAANNGQFPGITLLRKEVGGKYETLKAIAQELAKDQDEPDTKQQTAEIKDAEEKAQQFPGAVEEGIRVKSSLRESSEKDKKEKSLGAKAVKSVDPGTTSKDIESVMQGKSASKETGLVSKDSGLISDDDDDDSDVAAPEYHHSPSIQKGPHKMDEGEKLAEGKENLLKNRSVTQLKNDMKKQNDDQTMKAKYADIKQPEADIKQAEVQDGGIRFELPYKGRDAVTAVDDTAAEHLSADGSFSFGNRSYGVVPLTTVVRIVNLPQHLTANKLKAICESFGRVHDVDFRRPHIADVHFDVDLQDMSSILSRLRKVSIGSLKLRVFPAQKFSCGKNAKSPLKPQTEKQYKQVRNVLFSALEQKFKFLSWQLQDYRELQELKLAR